MDDELSEEEAVLILGALGAELYLQNIQLLKTFRATATERLDRLQAEVEEFVASESKRIETFSSKKLPQTTSWPPSPKKTPESFRSRPSSHESLRSHCSMLRQACPALRFLSSPCPFLYPA